MLVKVNREVKVCEKSVRESRDERKNLEVAHALLARFDIDLIRLP